MNAFFTISERAELLRLYKQLLLSCNDSVTPLACHKLKSGLIEAAGQSLLRRDNFGMNPIIRDLRTALIVSEEMGIKGSCLTAIIVHELVGIGAMDLERVSVEFGQDTARIVKGLVKINALYAKSPVIESENFRNLLLSLAEDMRVILIMIADRVNVMRQIKDTSNEEDRIRVAHEAMSLYAPIAHKLGLYKLKSELEDLWLKYTKQDVYYQIKEKLNQTKSSRERYIASFIAPVRERLERTGLRFEIKGRTKSIHSIWNKMQKQKTTFEGIYDLFAIRVILDTPDDAAMEKQACWQVYSIVTDMYQPNPKRLRDWLSIPKSNGYESLHITVMGPQGKWVEVQIRTRRMDEVAERGLAAHWRYKGVKGETGLDSWLSSVREALESADSDATGAMSQFKMELYTDEVFVFTPKGDLFKLPKGATVLDFAFHIHSKLGCQCVGGKVNGKNAQIRQKLVSGDQVEIITSTTQTPKQDWLGIAVTARARTKIRQALKEMAARQHDYAKETIARKFKNRKMEYDEAVMMRLIKRLGFKNVTEFYQHIADGALDVNYLLDKYVEQQKRDSDTHEELTYRSAEGYSMQPTTDAAHQDVLLIDRNLKGVDFTLAKCCNPIYGDEVFGFVTVSGGIKIHRCDCPNASAMRERFFYRVVKAQWAGQGTGSQYPTTLRVVGNDDIGIVTNITSVISKEEGITLRAISINSVDGLFTGRLTVTVHDTGHLKTLLKKLRAVKGVKQISRD